MDTITEKYTVTADEWTLVAANVAHVFLQCYTCPKMRVRVGTIKPGLEDTDYFLVRKFHVVRYLKPFHSVWVRANTTPIDITVVKGFGGAGIDVFGRTVFNMFGNAHGQIAMGGVAYPTVNCGAPGTDFSDALAIDGGDPALGNPQAWDFHGYLEGETP